MKKYIFIISITIIYFNHNISYSQDSLKHTAIFNQQWLKNLVSIEILDEKCIGSPIGTGFLIQSPNKHIVLVTAKHVVFENDGNGPLIDNLGYRLNRKDGNSSLIPENIIYNYNKTGWFRSDKCDLAIRLFVREDSSDFSTITYSIFLQKQQMEAGAPLFIIGFPLGLRSDKYATPIVRRASIARVDKDTLIVDGFVYPGNSGGPVIYEPNLQFGDIFETTILQGDWFVGMVLAEISYIEPAISLQTKRARVTFEQNSGLSIILPSYKILELLQSAEFIKADESIIR